MLASRIIPILLFVLSGCNSSATPTETQAQSSVSTVTIAQADPSSVLDDNASTATVAEPTEVEFKRFRVSPYKVECEGFQLGQCLLISSDDHDGLQYFYDAIIGFDYQWGYEYDILVSVAAAPNEMSDSPQRRYELLDILSQSPYQRHQTFSYIARHGQQSLIRTADGHYALAGNQPVLCDPMACESIDSLVAQSQSALLRIEYGELPGSPLKVTSVDCVASSDAFNEACNEEA